MLGDVLGRVLRRRQEARQQLFGRELLAGCELDRAVHCEATDAADLLRRGGIEATLGEDRQSRRVAVEAADIDALGNAGLNSP